MVLKGLKKARLQPLPGSVPEFQELRLRQILIEDSNRRFCGRQWQEMLAEGVSGKMLWKILAEDVGGRAAL